VPDMRVPLPDAARRYGIQYKALWDAATCGEVRTEKRGGRLFVSLVSVAALSKRLGDAA
jgi:hypothetical protein